MTSYKNISAVATHCKSYKNRHIWLQTAIIAILLACSVCLSARAYEDNSSRPRTALLGDSMTWIGGDTCGNETGWSHHLKESGLTGPIDMYARSGATWTNTKATRPDPTFYSEVLHDDNVIYNQALRLIEKTESEPDHVPDLIIIFAGANDAWFSHRRPGIFNLMTIESSSNLPVYTLPSQATSLLKSIWLVCDMLRMSLPKSRIVLVTPLQMSKVSEEVTRSVSDIIESVAKRMKIDVIRPDLNVGISHEQELRQPTFTTDGVHTNPAGARLLAGHIINTLKEKRILSTDN